MNNYDEIPKHRKKKQSSSSKSKSKSKHKHEYADCLLIDKENRPHKAEYCQICGKINNVKMFESERIDSGHYRMLTDVETFQKYKNLEQFHVKEAWDKYVSISTGECD